MRKVNPNWLFSMMVTLVLALVVSTGVSPAIAQGVLVERPDNLAAVAGGPGDDLDIIALARSGTLTQKLNLSTISQNATFQVARYPLVSQRLPVDGFDISAVLVGPAADGVPCFGCVVDSSGNPVSPAIGLPIPTTIVPSGALASYVAVYWVEQPFQAPCGLTIVGIRLADRRPIAGAQGQVGCDQQAVYVAWLDQPVFDFPGDAILLAIITAPDGTTDMNFAFYQVQ